MKILGWNINQRTGKNIEIPNFVVLEINNNDPDIAILTEFVKGVNWESFISSLEKNYHVFCYSKTIDKQNEVLIAVKKPISVIGKVEAEDDIVLDFLEVEIEHRRKPLSIIGVRIRIEDSSENDYMQRKQQFDSLMKYLQSKGNKNSIIIGDFNNSKLHGGESVDYADVRNRYSKLNTKHYNYHLIKDQFEKSGYNIHTPKGNVSSWGGYIKNDHIVASESIRVANLSYSWEFMNHDTLEYKNGKNYRPRKGYPDHAILIATVKLDD